jgi:hypothetical protein
MPTVDCEVALSPETSIVVLAPGLLFPLSGFDSAPTALARARELARARGVEVEIVEADATRLDGLDQRFMTVIDSALYHCLGDEERTAYAAALHRVTLAGAELHMLCFSDSGLGGFRVPAIQVSQDDLRTHLGEHWDIRSIELTSFTTTMTPELLAEQRNVLEGMGGDVDLGAVRTDERGRITMSVWHLHAVRR